MALARMTLGSSTQKSSSDAAGGSPSDNFPRSLSEGNLRSAKQTLTKPVQLSVSTTSLPKLATLDWPPPPSPAGTVRAKSAIGDNALNATVPTPGATFPVTPASTRPAEAKNRAELWAARSDIEQEKLRNVVPYPFFGRAMRFEDELSALQITDDGRFSYSEVRVEGLDGSERPGTEEPTCRYVTTYEGILVAPTEDQPTQSLIAEPVKDQETASVEGRAMAKHGIEDTGGRARLVSVERKICRFSITVKPFFRVCGAMAPGDPFCGNSFVGDEKRDTAEASVQPIIHRTPGMPAPRKKQLQYVGTGVQTKREVQIGSTAKAGDMRRLTQERRRAPKLKFSMSSAGLAAVYQGKVPSKEQKAARHSLFEGSGAFDALQELHDHSSSAPQLTGLSRPPQKGWKRKKSSVLAEVLKDGDNPSVADWREFYKQRAQRMLAA